MFDIFILHFFFIKTKFIQVVFSFIQIRSSLKSSHVFGRLDEVTCGGNALRFYAAVRLRIMRTGLLKTEDKVNLRGYVLFREI